jgi:arylsulfatase A-like enzyme
MDEDRKDNPETGAKSRRRLLLSRRDFLAAGASAAVVAGLPLGCGGDEEAAAPSAAADPAAAGTPWANTEKALDLVESVHLADISHRGEFVDFGTAARFKYTLGGWMTGWDGDVAMNGMAFTWASQSPSRLYFSLERAAPLTLEFRAKPGGADSFSVYLNDKPLTKVSLQGGDFATYRIKAQADQTLAGENQLKLIYSSAPAKLGGAFTSIAVDYLRIIPEGEEASAGFDPPYLAALRQTFKAGGRERESLLLTPPTTLSYYLDVPAGAKLSTAVALAQGNRDKGVELALAIKARPADGGPPVELCSRSYTKEGWSEELIDLAPVAGRLVRLELAVTGQAAARLALGDLALRLPPARIEPVGKKARGAIVLVIDTLRADKLSVYGKTRVKTPVFDRFATESMVFERCQANGNWTKPSCATLLTGMHPDTHKTRGHTSKLAGSVPMASEIFRDAGFKTGAFIANGYLATEFGFNRGWTQYVNYIREKKNSDAENVFKDALEFVTQAKDGPFYVYIQTIDPHVPYDPPEEDLKLYDAASYEGPVKPRSTGNLLDDFKRKRVELDPRDRRRLEALYDGEVTYHDRQFGHFLDGLRQLGVLDDTVIIVTADHGEEFFEHDSVGHGHSLYQELLRVPLAVRAPRQLAGGKRSPLAAALTDVLPTALAATGQQIPGNLEGRDLIAACGCGLPDHAGASFSSFWSEADGRNLQWAVRQGDWKLLMRGPVRSYLYNLAEDPKERTDLDERHPIALRALRIALGQFIGNPDKRHWARGLVASQAAPAGPAAAEEETAIPDDLKDQLRQLGYMN